MKSVPLPRIGMRVVKTAVAVMLSYTIFVPFGLIYNEALGACGASSAPLCLHRLHHLHPVHPWPDHPAGPLPPHRRGGGRSPGYRHPAAGRRPGRSLGTHTRPGGGVRGGVWICLLLKRPTACGMACILPCVILITGVTGVTRYYYAAARIIETVVGLLIALGVNAALPDLRPEPKRRPRTCRWK
ncbi:hypothetical protein M5E87_03675 [Flavonifractor plautii]|nr:hypothetical protein M5E87_03675 [Flavonifractor plautii]